MSGVFATAGGGDVRVWCVETAQELLRIVVPNFTCSAVLFSADGKSIVTGRHVIYLINLSVNIQFWTFASCGVRHARDTTFA